MRSNYKFDWNIVLKLDPSYKQYLEDINDNFNKTSDDETVYYNNVPGQSLAQEQVVDIDTHWRAKGLSEDEKDIIDMMHNDTVEPVEEGGVEDPENTPVRKINAEQDSESYYPPDYCLKAKYHNYPAQTCPDVLMITPPKRVLTTGSGFWINEDVYYQVARSRERDPDIVNITKQKIYRNPDKVGMMRITYRLDRIRDVSSERKKMFRMVVYNLKTAKLYYITGQDNGKHKRITKRIAQMGLNKNGIQAIIGTTNDVIATRFVQIVKDHVLNLIPDAYVPEAPIIPKRPNGIFQVTPRVIRIDEKVLATLNNTNYRNDVFYALFLQHKVGCRLEWLSDEKFLGNVDDFVSDMDIVNKFLGNIDGEINKITKDRVNKRLKAFKTKTVYTVFPKLKKRPGAKTVTRALFGRWYKDIYHKIMTWNDGEHDNFQNAVIFLINLSFIMDNGFLPNETYHLISRLVKRGDVYAYIQLLQLSIIVRELRGDPWSPTAAPDIVLVRKVQLYTRIATKLFEQMSAKEINPYDMALIVTEEVVSWGMFNDTMDMAAALNIRVRINKFTCARDIRTMHDRFATFQQRDLEVHNKYDAYTFLKFEAPDKEYDGFRFIQLLTPADLVEEGKVMHHCVGGYSPNCLKGSSIIFSMFKERSWVTIELDGTDLQYNIRQKYTIKDFTIRNSSMLGVIDKWHADVVKMHMNDKDRYTTLARAYHEYQKNIIKLEKYNNMKDDNLNPDERKWLEQAIKNTTEALENSAMTMQLEEVPNATPFEQVHAQA